MIYLINRSKPRASPGEIVKLAVPYKSFRAHDVPESAWISMVPYLSQLYWWTPAYANFHRRRSNQAFPFVPMWGHIRGDDGRIYLVEFVRLDISNKDVRLTPDRLALAHYRVVRPVSVPANERIVEGWQHHVAFDKNALSHPTLTQMENNNV